MDTIDRRLPAPQSCEASPPQGILQSLAGASVPLLTMPLPQKHCVLYSVPETIYPASLQALAHDWGVIVAESGAWKLRIRPWALSTQQPWLDHPSGKPVSAGVTEVADGEDTLITVPVLETAEVVPGARVVALDPEADVEDATNSIW